MSSADRIEARCDQARVDALTDRIIDMLEGETNADALVATAWALGWQLHDLPQNLDTDMVTQAFLEITGRAIFAWRIGWAVGGQA